jgi:phosphoribosylanthranilate isomerase
MVRVKICGITSVEDAFLSIDEGADAVGFVFYEKSKRFVSVDRAKKISASLPPFVFKVGVFVNSSVEKILEICDEVKLNAVQLHGNEDVEFCKNLLKRTDVIKAVGIENENDIVKAMKYRDFFVLFDTKTPQYGGSGKSFDWNLLAPYTHEFGYFIVSGGLNEKNVSEVVNLLSPFAVDVSSGVEEKPGKKNPTKIRNFIKKAKGLL